MVFESYFALFVAAFLASLSHCIPMCGGIALGLNMRFVGRDSKDSNIDFKTRKTSKITQILANILYFCGRSFSYIFIGLLFSVISVGVGFSERAHAIMLIVLGILLIIFAFCATFLPKFLSFNTGLIMTANTQNSGISSVFRFYKNTFKKMLKAQSLTSFFVIGILNGLLPCHLVYMFALSAASSVSLWQSLVVMVLFCVATFPVLFGVGLFATSVANSRLKGLFMQLAFIIMCFFAANNIYKGVSFFTQDSTRLESNPHNQHLHHH